MLSATVHCKVTTEVLIDFILNFINWLGIWKERQKLAFYIEERIDAKKVYLLKALQREQSIKMQMKLNCYK